MKFKPQFLIVYIVVLFAILNGPLRLSADGMTSLYRIFGPLLGLYVIGINFHNHKYRKELLLFILMMVYSAFVSIVFYNHIEFQEVVIVIYVFILYTIIRYMKTKDVNFNEDFMNFLDAICFITVLLAWLQMFVPYSVPFIENATIRRAVNVYFSNENELGSALACITLVNVFQMMYLGVKKRRALILFDITSSIFIMYKNDAKLSLLGTVVGILIILFYIFRKPNELRANKKQSSKDQCFFIIFVGVVVMGIVALFVVNPSIPTRDYQITIREMLFDNIAAIITGKEIEGIGTYHDRSSAIIYGLREWSKTYFFGIGLGNSWTMLQMPQYILPFAKSMHNIIAQFLVELGFFALLLYAKIIKSTIAMFGRVRNSPIALLKGTYVIAFVFISSQSSSGILSNYLTIVCTIYVFLMDEVQNFHVAKKKRTTERDTNEVV